MKAVARLVDAGNPACFMIVPAVRIILRHQMAQVRNGALAERQNVMPQKVIVADYGVGQNQKRQKKGTGAGAIRK